MGGLAPEVPSVKSLNSGTDRNRPGAAERNLECPILEWGTGVRTVGSRHQISTKGLVGAVEVTLTGRNH